jgi:hypothetical protein
MRNYTDYLFTALDEADAVSLESLFQKFEVEGASLVSKAGLSDVRVDLPKYLFDNAVLGEAEFYADMAAPLSPLEHLMPSFVSPVVDMVRSVLSSSSEGSDRTIVPFLYQWYLGPALSGAPFHSHAPAFNVLVHGEKLWHLRPPGSDIYSNEHPLASLQKEQDGRTVLGSCALVQEAGEVLFVPRHVSHSVINLKESVGFAVEVSDY